MGAEVQLEETWRFQGKNTKCFRKFSENDPAEPFLKKYAGVRPVFYYKNDFYAYGLLQKFFE